MDIVSGDKESLKTIKIKVGRRVYFFDVKETLNGELYLVMNEAKITADGKLEKHKIYLYKEAFYRFSKAFNEVTEFVKEKHPEYLEPKPFDEPAE